MPDYQLLKELLGMADVDVTHYRLIGSDQIELSVCSIWPAAVCPDCQAVSTLVHDSAAPQRLRDLPIWGRQCWLAYTARRYDCVPCGRTFVERVGWRDLGQDYTVRYSQHIFERARREPVAQVAQAEQLSQDQVQGLFERGAKKQSLRAAIR